MQWNIITRHSDSIGQLSLTIDDRDIMSSRLYTEYLILYSRGDKRAISRPYLISVHQLQLGEQL